MRRSFADVIIPELPEPLLRDRSESLARLPHLETAWPMASEEWPLPFPVYLCAVVSCKMDGEMICSVMGMFMFALSFCSERLRGFC